MLTSKIFSVNLLEGLSDEPTEFVIALDDIPLNQIKGLNSHNNTIYVECMCIKTVQHNRTNLDVCGGKFALANRFVYIYTHPINFLPTLEATDVLAVVLYGGKRVYGNNNPSVLTTLNGWVSESDLSAVLADEILGKLEQSGITKRWRVFTQVFGVLKLWKKIEQTVFESAN